MEKFFAGFFAGVLACGYTLALTAKPSWEDQIVSAKSALCQNLNSTFVHDTETVSGGMCVNGDTITYRFKK